MIDPATALAIAKLIKMAVDLGPNVLKTVEDVKPFAEILIGSLRGKKMTPEQIAQMRAQIDALSDEFQKPLPPEGETT